eukprot:GHVU01045738.1.p3 GENE.GHVU01045738.1~~GHVU01045738.1.p3  ORF type:complete len:110 (-),score=10.35 GHVU01045738.1:11-340(-)
MRYSLVAGKELRLETKPLRELIIKALLKMGFLELMLEAKPLRQAEKMKPILMIALLRMSLYHCMNLRLEAQPIRQAQKQKSYNAYLIRRDSSQMECPCANSKNFSRKSC